MLVQWFSFCRSAHILLLWAGAWLGQACSSPGTEAVPAPSTAALPAPEMPYEGPCSFRETFDHYAPGALTPQSRYWFKRNPAAGGDARVRRTPTNGYIGVEHDPALAPHAQPMLCLPLAPGPGRLSLRIWVSRPAPGRVVVLPHTPGADSLELLLTEELRLIARIGASTRILTYPREAWLYLSIQQALPEPAPPRLHLLYTDNNGVRHTQQTDFDAGPLLPGTLLLDASTPHTRLLIDDICYASWSTQPAAKGQ